MTSGPGAPPRGQFVRFLIAGAFNTLFGYAVFAGLYHLLRERIHYVIVAVVSNVIAITFAYINYKFSVFKTTGNCLREYLRFYVVYGASIGLSLVLLPFCVEVLGFNPYVGQAIVVFITVTISFFAHRSYSFKT